MTQRRLPSEGLGGRGGLRRTSVGVSRILILLFTVLGASVFSLPLPSESEGDLTHRIGVRTPSINAGDVLEPVGAITDAAAVPGPDPAQGAGQVGQFPPPLRQQLAADPERAASLLLMGDRALEVGDVAAARGYYEAAYDTGSAAAATALGRTYDPIFLAERNTFGLQADQTKAMSWYLKGSAAGDPVARQHVDALIVWLRGQASAPNVDP